MFTFQHIEYLGALILIPVLVLLFLGLLRWKKTRIQKIGDEKLVKELFRDFSPAKFAFRFVLFIVALGLIITGTANLQSPGSMEKVSRKGVDVMIAMDVSKSMLANDIQPNRLERAKQLVNKMVEKMKNDRIGIVLFAGRAYIQMPLTTDHSAARMYIQDARPEAIPVQGQGTVIAEALKTANAAFNSKDRKFKSIILISDGEDHDEEALKFTEALVKNGVMINTVGIGSTEGVPLTENNQLRKDAQGNAIITKLNEAELKQLAQQTKGIYVHLTDSDEAANKIFDQLSTIEQTSLGDQTFMDYKSYFQWFLGAAVVLLLIEFFTPERKKAQLT